MNRKQKSHIRRWRADLEKPWLTRSEAADYLGWHVRTLDRSLVKLQKEQVPGKIRFMRLETATRIKAIRVRAEDVYALAPPAIK